MVRGKRQALWAAGALLLVTQAGGAGQSGDPVTLKMKFKPGDASRYQTTAQILTQLLLPGQPTPVNTTMDVSLVQVMKVTKALPNGGGEVTAATVSGEVLLNGQPQASPSGAQPTQVSYDAQGNLMKIYVPRTRGEKGALFGGLLGSGALSMQRVYLPTRPVRPGESWTQPVKMPGAPVFGTGTVKAKFLRVENVGHFQTAKLQATLTMPLKVMLDAALQPTLEPARAVTTMVGALTMNYDSNFAIAEGKLVRLSGNGTINGVLKPKATLKPAPKPASQRKPGAPKTPPVPPPMQITLKLSIGNNLIEQ